MTRICLELGCDHLDYGDFACGRIPQDGAWAISVGADEQAPSMRAKGDPEVPNEDALLIAEHGGVWLLAVADAHFGRAPSHAVLDALSKRIDPPPATIGELHALLEQLSEGEPIVGSRAGTSLVIALYDRSTRQGFGVSYGDSTFAVLGAAGYRRGVDHRTSEFIYLARPSSLDPLFADTFTFAAEPGDLLLAFTDGINECHYGQPATSVTPEEMQRLLETVGNEPEIFLRAVVELALAGVDGNPGGQDNIAAVAVRA